MAGDAEERAFPSPTVPRDSRADVLLGYLDFFRDGLLAKVTGLSEQDQRTSRLPSGWTPLDLVRHLTFVERRWLVWGFEGRDVGDPWGDQVDGRWHVGDDKDAGQVLAELEAQGGVTTQVVRRHDLDEVGAPGPRWDGAAPATLERVLLHLVQEHARHLGHIDVVAELAAVRRGSEVAC